MIFILSFLVTLTSSAHAEEEAYFLEPVYSEGSTYDVLKFDSFTPSFERKQSKKLSSNGGISKEIGQELPYHLSENTRPGNVVNFQGSGKRPEDIDVNFLGIPLNAPQGGGFDLNSFPQYLWSGFSFQQGPSAGAYDPRGVAGSLSLKLWTQEAITSTDPDRPVAQASLFRSSARLSQLSAAGTNGNVAAIAGISDGQIEGPAGSISAKIVDGERFRLKGHVVVTHQKVNDLWSERSSASGGTQRIFRLIPVLQIDYRATSEVLTKWTLFYDKSYIANEDPNSPYGPAYGRSRSHVYQGGLESAILYKKTKLGLALRQTDYKNSRFSSEEVIPTEQIFNAQLTHTFDFDAWTIEPSAGGTAVTRFGFLPMFSLGVRRPLGDGTFNIYSRSGFHRRFASLTDRYYKTQYTSENPGIRPEKVLSEELGTEWDTGRVSGSISAFGRVHTQSRYYDIYLLDATRRNVLVPGKVNNRGRSYVYGLLLRNEWDATSYTSLKGRLALTRGRFDTENEPFTYLPEAVGILALDLHDPSRKYSVEFRSKRASSYFGGSETSESLVKLPKYQVFDAELAARVMKNIAVSAAVENIFNRSIEYRVGQPSMGRIYSMNLQGSF